MSVNIHGSFDIFMTQTILNLLNTCTGFEKQAGMSMTESMNSDKRSIIFLNQIV